eukprot:3736227-Amphidinium_carterae.1
MARKCGKARTRAKKRFTSRNRGLPLGRGASCAINKAKCQKLVQRHLRLARPATACREGLPGPFKMRGQ